MGDGFGGDGKLSVIGMPLKSDLLFSAKYLHASGVTLTSMLTDCCYYHVKCCNFHIILNVNFVFYTVFFVLYYCSISSLNKMFAFTLILIRLNVVVW